MRPDIYTRVLEDLDVRIQKTRTCVHRTRHPNELHEFEVCCALSFVNRLFAVRTLHPTPYSSHMPYHIKHVTANKNTSQPSFPNPHSPINKTYPVYVHHRHSLSHNLSTTHHVSHTTARVSAQGARASAPQLICMRRRESLFISSTEEKNPILRNNEDFSNNEQRHNA